MSDANETAAEHTPSLESQLMASLDKADSGTKTAVVEAVAPDTKEEVKETKEVTEVSATNGDAEAKDDTEKKADDDEAEETEDESLDPDFVAAAEKHRIPTADDLPPELKPLWDKKAKEMQAGFTRAMQEQRAYRKREAELDSDIQYRKESPDKWLADFIQQHPDVIDKVNTELEKRSDPTYAEAQKMKRDAARDRAEVDARNEQDAQAARDQRATEIESVMETSAKKSGIPLALVEEAVAFAITTKAQKGEEISDDEVDSIVQAKAKVYRQSVGAHKGAKTRQYAKDKAADAKGGVTPPKSAVVNESTPAAKPKSLEEAFNRALDNIGAAA